MYIILILIGHVQVDSSFCLKTRRSAEPFNEEINFKRVRCKEDLVLKMRVFGTRRIEINIKILKA